MKTHSLLFLLIIVIHSVTTPSGFGQMVLVADDDGKNPRWESIGDIITTFHDELEHEHSGGGTSDDPGDEDPENLDWQNFPGWKLTLPVDEDGRTSGRAMEIEDITGYSSKWFTRHSDRVTFTSPEKGATTKGSSQPRSELREMTPDGKEQINWDGRRGTHQMAFTISFDKYSDADIKGGQVHDADEDRMMLVLSGGAVWISIDGKKSNGAKVIPNYNLGDKLEVLIRFKDGEGDITINGNIVDLKKDLDGRKDSYFKVGAYGHDGVVSLYGPPVIEHR